MPRQCCRRPRLSALKPSRWRVCHALLIACSAWGCDRQPNEAAVQTTASPATSTAVAALSSADREQVIARANAAITPFKKQLSEALMSALQHAGPLAAIDVCAEAAPRLAKEASSQDVVVGRSALKLRNPSNAARDWLEPVLSELAQLPSAEGAQRVVPLPDNRVGYAEAIVLKPPCVVCHGPAVAPELAAAIKARYPRDQATGFETGQLRGVFWAELALRGP